MENSVYVGNLDQSVSLAKMEELIYELFVQAGPIASVHLPYDQVTGLHKTFGFVEFQIKESVICSLSLLGGLSLYGRPLKVRATAKNEQQSPAPSCVSKSPGEADAPNAPSTASSPVADERNASIEAKLQEQFGSRLSPPAPCNHLESHQQCNTLSTTLLNDTSGQYENTENVPASLERPPSLPSNLSGSLLPSLPPGPPPLFPSRLPRPLLEIPPPPPGLPPPPFLHPPPLPLPPTSLFPNLLSPQRDSPPTDLLATPPCTNYNYERQLQPGVSVTPSPLMSTLASQGSTTTASLPQSIEDLYNPEMGRIMLGHGFENRSGTVESSSPFIEGDGCHCPELHSQSLEGNYRSRNGVNGNLDFTEDVENENLTGSSSDFSSTREVSSNHLSYCDESPSCHQRDNQNDSNSMFKRRGHLRQNNRHHGRQRSNHKNGHKLNHDVHFSGGVDCPEHSHSWHEHTVHSSSSSMEEGAENLESNLKRLQMALKAMQHSDI